MKEQIGTKLKEKIMKLKSGYLTIIFLFLPDPRINKI